MSVVPTPAPPPTLPLGAGARAEREVSVHVVGPDGDVEGARVCAARTGGRESCATSGSSGRASLAIVPGTYAVRAVPARGARLAEGVATVEVVETTEIVVSVQGRGTVSGGVRDVDGRAVAGAEACAHGLSPLELRCARSDGEGRYRVEVQPGLQKVEVSGPPGSRLLTQWATGRMGSFEADVIDTRREDATGVDVVLRAGVALTGVITAARDGSPVEEAQVCTYPHRAPLGWDCELTDERGRYAVLREPDVYWVWVIPPEKRGSRLVYQRHDRVQEGVDATPFELFQDRTLDVALTEGPLLHGRVTATDGAPVVLALVCLDTPFPTGRICRSTGDDGSYEIATRPQTYVVNVYPPEGSEVIAGFWPDAARDWTAAGEVRVGPADRRLDIVLPRGVRLSGVVRDARGSPVEGATVNVNDATGPRFFGSTNAEGRYSISVLPGDYTVDVFSPRYLYSLSVMGQPLSVTGETGYEVVLPDAEAQD